MSTNNQDLGATPKQRLWSINKHTVLNADFDGIQNPRETYCFRFPKSHFRSGAQSFDQFRNGERDHTSRHMQILYQAVFEMVRLLIETYKDLPESYKNGDHNQEPKIPLHLFLELVPASEDDDAAQTGGNTMHPLEHLHEQNMPFEFLRGDPNIIEYRVWLFITHSKLELGKALRSMMENNLERNNDLRKTIARSTVQNPNTDIYYRLKAHEKFRMIESVEFWRYQILDIVVGKDTRHNENVARDVLELDNITRRGTTVHPQHVFFALNAMRFPCPGIDAAFRTIENYAEVSSQRHYFPVPSNVLKISLSHANPMMMSSRYFPDQQKKQQYATMLEMHQERRAHSIEQWVQAVKDNPGQAHAPPEDISNFDDEMREAFIAMNGVTPEEFMRAHPDAQTMPTEDEQRQQNNKEWDAIYKVYGVEGGAPIYEDELGLDPDIVGEQLPPELAGKILDRMMQNSHSSAYEELATQAKPYQRVVDETRDLDERQQRYELHRKWMFNEYAARCMSSEADIGKVCQMMLRWYEDNVHKTALEVSAHIYDPELSIFANMTVRFMEYFEKYMMFASTHKSFFTIYTGALDAYRHSLGLHWNNISCGPGSRSKSFMYDKIEEYSIPGTVRVYTFQSRRADAIDEDQNDYIDVQHETPLVQFQEDKGKFNEEEAHFKERLTSQMVRAKMFEYQPDGSRANRTTVSQCIGSWNGATNDGPDRLGEAFVSRFNWEWVKEVDRPDKNIIEMMIGEQYLSATEKRKRDNIQLEFMRLQFIHCQVEKLIWVGALKAPTLKASDIIFNKVNDYVRERTGAQIHTRTIQRMRFLVRSLVISLGIEYLYNIPGYSKYHGKPFEIHQLIDMDELLHDTEEMAYFVLGLEKEQFLDDTEKLVLRKLREYNRYTSHDARFRKRYEHRASSASYKHAGMAKPPPNFARSDPFAPRNRGVPYRGNDFDDDEHADHDDDAGDDASRNLDYNYLRVPYEHFRLPKKVHDEIDEDARPSTQSIQGVIKSLMSRSIRSYPYVYDADTKESVPDKTKPMRNFSAMVSDGGIDKHCYVHALLFEDEFLEDDTLHKAIESTFHKFSLPHKVIFGQVVDEKRYPNFFQTFWVKTRSENELRVKNPLYAGVSAASSAQSVDPSRRTPFRIVDNDIDTLSVMQRLQTLGMPYGLEETAQRHPLSRDSLACAALQSDSPSQDATMSYPEDHVTKLQKDVELWKNKSFQNDPDFDASALESSAMGASMGLEPVRRDEGKVYENANLIKLPHLERLLNAKRACDEQQNTMSSSSSLRIQQDPMIRFEEDQSEQHRHKRTKTMSQSSESSSSSSLDYGSYIRFPISRVQQEDPIIRFEEDPAEQHTHKRKQDSRIESSEKRRKTVIDI